MNLKQFKYLLTLAETKNFSKAANILNISQPSLSQYVKYLEKELDIQLFDRSGYELKLTDAGKEYIEVGKKILDLEHQLQSKFEDIKKCDCGTIRIGISLYKGTCIMPKVMALFKKKYPGVKVIIEEKLENNLIEDALIGGFDLLIINGPINENKFIFQKMFDEDLLLCTSMNMEIETINNAIDILSLDNKNFIVLDDNQLIQSQLNRLCNEYDIKINKTIECRNIITQIALVNEGIGCALVPSTVMNYSFNSSKITFYRINQIDFKRNVVVAYLKNHYLSEATKYLIHLLTTMEVNN